MEENENKIELLITYLKSLGFEGEKLERDIRDACKQYPTSFSVSHRMRFGEEQMSYYFYFLLDTQFHAYKLDNYTAVHRDPIIIEHKVINGIDTNKLEQRMREIDWEDLSLHVVNREEFDHLLSNTYPLLMENLSRLTEDYLFDGLEIRNQLIYKYWPGKFWDYEVQELAEVYETDQQFISNEFGIPNASLAYHTVSGHLYELLDQLRAYGLERLPGIDLKNYLEHCLSTGSRIFDITCSTPRQEGIIDYDVRLIGFDGPFTPEPLVATFTRYPEFSHGIYNEVDTQILEEDAKRINWADPDALFTAGEHGDAVIRPPIEDILSKMRKLCDSGNVEAATYIDMKYISQTNELYEFIPGDINALEANLPRVSARFPLDLNLDTRAIYNMMCGRTVKEEKQESMDTWLLLKSGNEEDLNELHIQKVKGMTEGEIQDRLDMLPLRSANDYSIRQSIMKGNVQKVELLDGKHIVIGMVSDATALEVYTADMEHIPFNFKFDPNWLPEHIEGNTKRKDQAKRLTKSVMKGKGYKK
ncbi:hypothetical protein FXV77_05505 [Sphingobacterium phlebotomi]|uniref:Uncharacterized protein n=1 Tax=Sphingobacterium phlebotomi TaxID=2605433 RepID=A0A5D4H8J1_9SPHI|nr:hypothetical protein [Sphingobacterium phlebotomi]TYR37461.1 hypothetical protein FXV77_05505 [Sphingobacterium phlebotomi]